MYVTSKPSCRLTIARRTLSAYARIRVRYSHTPYSFSEAILKTIRSSFAVAIAIASASGLAVLTAAATTQATQTAPSAGAVLNRMNSAYRSFRSYYDVATIKRRADKPDAAARLTLAMQRPNKFLLDLKGDRLNTMIASDGNTLIALRPDRKAYTKTRAPQLLMGSDIIGNVDVPSPGARIISSLLAANAREGELGKLLSNAKAAGPEGFGNKLAYVLTFPYGDDLEAKVYVTSDDYLIRQVKLLRNGTVEWTENHDDVQTDRPVPEGTFNRPLPAGAVMVATLPALEKASASAEDDPGGDLAADDPKKEAARTLAAISLYRSSGCSRCHNNGGAPDLTHVGADPDHTTKWIADQIKNPSMHNPGSSMPAFVGRLSEKSIDLLAAYFAARK